MTITVVLISFVWILFCYGKEIPVLYLHTRQFTSCNTEKRAVSCALVKVDFDVLGQENLVIPEESMKQLYFYRVLVWEVQGIHLIEYEVNNEGHYGYFTVMFNKKELYGNFEYKEYKYSIMASNDYPPDLQVVLRWQGTYRNKTQERVPMRQENQKVDGFPYYYDTLRNVYTESPWESQYKYMVLKGMNDRTTVVNVSVTVLFSPEVFYGAMLRSYDFGPQILAAYLIRQLDWSMKNSQIPINFEVRCIGFTTDRDIHRDWTGWSHGELNILGPSTYFNYFNTHKEERYGADLLFIIKKDIGDHSALSTFDGLFYKRMTIMVGEQFIFDKFIYAHELGHLLGCTHEFGNTAGIEPSIFIAYSYIMPNGFCGLMSNPLKRKCIPRLFFSNPLVKFQGNKTGTHSSNNALWITNNRFALQQSGNERAQCFKDEKINHEFLQQMIKSPYNSLNKFNHLFPKIPPWS